MRTLSKRLPLLLALIATAAAAPLMTAQPARAAPSDPAAAQIDSLDSALLDAMKGGASLGVKGRYRKLAPVITHVFNLPAMTQFAVGPAWTTFTPAQQASLIDAFGRLSIANYAHNFSAFGGEHFEIDPNVQTRGPDKIVQTHLILTHDKPVALNYRMRQSGGTWKVIDIYYGAISQLTIRRSDFAGPVASGGAQGLVTHLNALSANQMK